MEGEGQVEGQGVATQLGQVGHEVGRVGGVQVVVCAVEAGSREQEGGVEVFGCNSPEGTSRELVCGMIHTLEQAGEASSLGQIIDGQV